MKRIFGTVSLLMLLTVEVLTPITYAVDGDQDTFVEVSESSDAGSNDNVVEDSENVEGGGHLIKI